MLSGSSSGSNVPVEAGSLSLMSWRVTSRLVGMSIRKYQDFGLVAIGAVAGILLRTSVTAVAQHHS